MSTDLHIFTNAIVNAEIGKNYVRDPHFNLFKDEFRKVEILYLLMV